MGGVSVYLSKSVSIYLSAIAWGRADRFDKGVSLFWSQIHHCKPLVSKCSCYNSTHGKLLYKINDLPAEAGRL